MAADALAPCADIKPSPAMILIMWEKFDFVFNEEELPTTCAISMSRSDKKCEHMFFCDS